MADYDGDALRVAESLFHEKSGLDTAAMIQLTEDALVGCDDGELFLEYGVAEGLVFDDGSLRSSSYSVSSGYGLRGIAGEVAGYCHGDDITEQSLRRAGEVTRAAAQGHAAHWAEPPRATNQSRYGATNPLESPDFATKVRLLADIDAYARAKDSRIVQVTASMAASWRCVRIIRPDGYIATDLRPLVRMQISVVAADAGRRESGSEGCGGRDGFARWIDPQSWQAGADEAVRQALVNLDSRPAPAGEVTVVLGPGWPGVMLHEAVGHGLEGDCNRKKSSAFAGLLGKRVASPGVTVVDDGTIAGRRGSVTVDDEGTPSARNVLIEDGILVGYMQDRQNARLMGMVPTGNGRRESYTHLPMPRMTNTFMLGGSHDPEEIIRSVKRGVYAVQFGGGQVDTTNGKFVFSCTEAYLIEDGRITSPIKGATLIGNGPDALTRVSMVGNDMQLDNGIGTCGKNGQSVPVGVGQPTLRIDGLTVGGTELAA